MRHMEMLKICNFRRQQNGNNLLHYKGGSKRKFRLDVNEIPAKKKYFTVTNF